MNYFNLAILTFIVYICVYTIINRICTCIEQCSIAKAYSKFIDQSGIHEEIINDSEEEK